MLGAAGRFVAAEIGMQAPGAAVVDERDELRRPRIDRRLADVLIPPVVGVERAASRRAAAPPRSALLASPLSLQQRILRSENRNDGNQGGRKDRLSTVSRHRKSPACSAVTLNRAAACTSVRNCDSNVCWIPFLIGVRVRWADARIASDVIESSLLAAHAVDSVDESRCYHVARGRKAMRQFGVMGIALTLALSIGCGKSEEQKAAEKAAEETKKAAEALEEGRAENGRSGRRNAGPAAAAKALEGSPARWPGRVRTASPSSRSAFRHCRRRCPTFRAGSATNRPANA